MRYFKLVTYTDGSEYETHEKLIDEPTFRKYQKALAEGNDFIITEDRVIKRKMIKEILPADDVVGEYVRSGVSLKSLGLPETPMIEEKKDSGVSKFAKLLSDKMGFGDDARTEAQEQAAKEERR